MRKVICPYCNRPAELVDSVVVYGRSYGMIWMCADCDAWVGTHKQSDSHAPLGSLANGELRYWRAMAHASFDPLWQASTAPDIRRTAYRWLAEQLGINVKSCHISWFDVAQCQRVVTTCLPRAMKGYVIDD